MAVRVVIALAVLLAGLGLLLLLGTLLRRRPPATAGPSGNRIISSPAESDSPPPAPGVAAPVPDSAEVAVNRRLFLNRAILLATTIFAVAFGGGTLAILWPNKVAGFGGVIKAGTKEELKEILASESRYYNGTGRFYLVPYDTSDPENVYVKAGVAADGMMALYQKCAHLGCRVPFCEPSQWFECPCHGSKYNLAGEVQPGSPAPAGLSRFKLVFEGSNVIVDTSAELAIPAKGFDSINQPPAGPHCTGAGEGSGH